MKIHLENHQDWLNWSPEKDPYFTISRSLIVTLAENNLVSTDDIATLKQYQV